MERRSVVKLLASTGFVMLTGCSGDSSKSDGSQIGEIDIINRRAEAQTVNIRVTDVGGETHTVEAIVEGYDDANDTVGRTQPTPDWLNGVRLTEIEANTDTDSEWVTAEVFEGEELDCVEMIVTLEEETYLYQSTGC